MLEISEIESLREELIANWTNNFEKNAFPNAELPAYLSNHFLVNQIANQSNTIIQIFDMNNFKTIYTSPNCLQITGFTDVELNNTGFTYWLRTLPIKQILFYIKSSQFVNEKLKKVAENDLHFSNQCINLAFKNKKGENRSMISTNSCIEWNGNKQKFQLILWRDMTEKFKSPAFCVRYKIGKSVYNYSSAQAKHREGDILTDKEKEVISWFQQGFSSKIIADKMDLSPFTVDNHKKNILTKLQTNSMDSVSEILKFVGM